MTASSKVEFQRILKLYSTHLREVDWRETEVYVTGNRVRTHTDLPWNCADVIELLERRWDSTITRWLYNTPDHRLGSDKTPYSGNNAVWSFFFHVKSFPGQTWYNCTDIPTVHTAFPLLPICALQYCIYLLQEPQFAGVFDFEQLTHIPIFFKPVHNISIFLSIVFSQTHSAPHLNFLTMFDPVTLYIKNSQFSRNKRNITHVFF